MADLRIVPASPDHIGPVAANMRQADRNELAASSGRSPFEALSYSVSRSTMARTVLVNDAPAGIFGVGDISILSRVGSPWLLGTDGLALAPVAFLRASVDWRDQLLASYDTLRNLVDDRNASSIRWLGWLGFSFKGPYLVGPHKLPFRLFELRR